MYTLICYTRGAPPPSQWMGDPLPCAGVVSAWVGKAFLLILDANVLLSSPVRSVQESRERGVVELKGLMTDWYRQRSKEVLEDL